MAELNANYVDAGAYGLMGLGSVATGYAQGQALNAQSSFQKTMAAINARMAKRQADGVIKVGDEQANQIKKKGQQIAGAQRASAAAQGLDVTDGSVADQLADTDEAVKSDMLNVRNNAWRQAWGIEAQSSLDLQSANTKADALRSEAGQTLLTGGLQALGYGAKSAGAFKASPSASTKVNGSLDFQFDGVKARRYLSNESY